MKSVKSPESLHGLDVFIRDVKKCSPEEEEKKVKKEQSKIRKKIHEQKNLDGPARRKYVAKMLFMSLMGYDNEFGNEEAVKLTSSAKIPEKLMGYIHCGTLLNGHIMVRELIPSLRGDLESQNPIHISLALSAIANLSSPDLAILIESIRKMLIGQVANPTIAKKALLALLSLYRCSPGEVSKHHWVDIFEPLLLSNNCGVLMGVMSLLNEFARDTPSNYIGLYGKVADIYTRVIIGKQFQQEYLYYQVPCPWLQIKLLKFFQLYPDPANEDAHRVVQNVIRKVVSHSSDVAKAPYRQINAYNAVLFECISLVLVFQDKELMKSASIILSAFLGDSKTFGNHVFHALRALAQLTRVSTDATKELLHHQNLVLGALKTKDITIRRECVQILYMICNKSSVSKIVGELLSYLQKTINDNIDFVSRDELVLKISILSEKYSPSNSWYVDTMLKLIAIAGDNMIDHIWYRAIKIITNHEDVQEYATLTVFNALREPSCNTTMVKVGSYILGEYGNLIADKAGSDQKTIFQVVHQHFVSSDDDRSKAVILSTYMKFINLFDDLAPIIINIFDHYRSCIDSEIQQRACEYLALATCNDRGMIENVCDVMPAYEETKDDLEFALEYHAAEVKEDEPEQIVFTDIPLPQELAGGEKLVVDKLQKSNPGQSPFATNTASPMATNTGLSQEERDRERARKKQLKKEAREVEKQKAQLENYHKEAVTDLTTQFQERQQQLHDQELQLQRAEQELIAKEKMAQKKLARLEAKEKEKEAAKNLKRDQQVEAKKQEITAHFQTQKTQAEQMLQQQAMTVQQQQLMALAEQQKAAEQELIQVAKQVVAQQEAEIMEKKKQSELLLRAQFAEAMKAHEQALTLQGQRAQALVDKEQQLVTMQQQLQKQFEEKQAQINMEATRQLELAKAKAQQEQEKKAAELRVAAQQQAAILQQKEAALNQQQQLLAAKEQRVREAEEKERNLAAREAQLAQQQALLMKQAQDAAQALALEKQRMADESNKAMMQAAAMLKQEREKLALQQMQQQQDAQKMAMMAEQERQRLAAIAMQEAEKMKQKQQELELAKMAAVQQMQAQQQVLQQQALAEQQRLAQVAALAEQERKKAEIEKAQALAQQQQAMQQQQQAQALALAQQQAQAMATQAEQMRLAQASQQAQQQLAQQQQAMQQQQLQQQALMAQQQQAVLAQAAQMQAQAMLAHAEMIRKASIMDKGNVYEDSSLGIAMNSQFGNGKGRMEIYFTNKSTAPFNNFEVKMQPVPYLTFQLNPPARQLNPNQQGTLQLAFSCDAPFDSYPELHIAFVVNNAVQQAKIHLPIGLTRFCEPLVLQPQEWYTRWSQISGAPQEITEQFIAVTCNPQHISALFKDGFRWAILPGVDPSPNNLVGAGTFHSSRGSVHCYMRLETFPQQNGIRLTIKSGSSEVNAALRNIFLAQLSQQKPQQAPPTQVIQPQPSPQPTMINPYGTTTTMSQPNLTTNRQPVPTVGPNIFATNVTTSTTMRQNVPQPTNVFATNTNQNTPSPSQFGTNVFGTARVNVQPQNTSQGAFANVFATNVNAQPNKPTLASPFQSPQSQPSASQILNSRPGQPTGY